MESKKVIRYYCEHCRKGFWKKQVCLEHEERCYFNQVNKKCGSCIQFNNYYCMRYEKDLFIQGNLPLEDNYAMVYPEECIYWKNNK